MDNNPTKTVADLRKEDPLFDFSRAYNMYARHNTNRLVMIFASKVDEKERSTLDYHLDGEKIENKNISFSISYRSFNGKEVTKLSFPTKTFWSTRENAERDLEEYINQYHKEFQKLNSKQEILDFVNRPEEEE